MNKNRIKKMRKAFKEQVKEVDNSFVCEICLEKTLKIFEGSEPNTCQDCMPLINLKEFEEFSWIE